MNVKKGKPLKKKNSTPMEKKILISNLNLIIQNFDKNKLENRNCKLFY